MISISIFWSDMISSTQLDISANFYRNGNLMFSRTQKFLQKAKNVNFRQKLGHLLKMGRSDNDLTTLKVFSASKIAYLGLWLMFQFDMVEPTLKK